MTDSLPSLPKYEPRADLWARIEAELTHRNAQPVEGVEGALPDGPPYHPKPPRWEAIPNEWDKEPIRSIWNESYLRWIWAGSTVAAVLLLVGHWVGLRSDAPERVRIEYIVESTRPPMRTQPTSKRLFGPNKAEVFIAQQCAQQRPACQRPEVHELRNQLVELTTQQQRLAHERHVFGNVPVLIRAQQKLDDQRVQVLNELLTILGS